MDKYRWHDLRKFPKDLPPNGEEVLVTTMNGRVYVIWHDENGWKSGTTAGSRYYTDRYIMAWKYIEPFEEVEE